MTDAQFYNGFVFRKFEYKKYHTTDCTQAGSPKHFFAYMTKGRAKLQCTSFTVELSAGDVFYIPYGMYYRSHWYPGAEFYSLGFSWLPTDIGYRMQKIECGDDARAVLDNICDRITVNAQSIAHLYTFFALVQKYMLPRESARHERTVSLALEYMRTHADYSVGDIAAHTGISESGLYSLFKKTLGRTPVDMRREILAEKATELLISTDLPIEKVSERLGFSSTSYFRKVLYRQTGKTPSQIRKEG